MYFATFSDSAPGGTRITRVWFTNDSTDYHLKRILYANSDLGDRYYFEEVDTWEEQKNKGFTIVAGNNSWIDYRSFNHFANRIIFTEVTDSQVEFLEKCFGYIQRHSPW